MISVNSHNKQVDSGQVLFRFVGVGNSGFPWLQRYLMSVWRTKPTSLRSHISLRHSHAHPGNAPSPDSWLPHRPHSPGILCQLHLHLLLYLKGPRAWSCPLSCLDLSIPCTLHGPSLPWLSRAPTLLPPPLPPLSIQDHALV